MELIIQKKRKTNTKQDSVIEMIKVINGNEYIQNDLHSNYQYQALQNSYNIPRIEDITYQRNANLYDARTKMNYLLNAGNQGSQYGNSAYGNDYQNSSQYTPLPRKNVDPQGYVDSLVYSRDSLISGSFLSSLHRR
jgi:hypothetical protein